MHKRSSALAAGIVSIIGLYRATLRASAREWHAEQWVAATRAARISQFPPRVNAQPVHQRLEAGAAG